MKVKKSEIQLLIAVIGVLIAVCTYFLVYSSFNEKSDALEAQNVTLSSQVATLEILDQRKADYIEATGKMQSYITIHSRVPPSAADSQQASSYRTNCPNTSHPQRGRSSGCSRYPL